MSKFTFEAIRGVNDILPESSPYWQWLEALCRQIAERYSYREIRLPLLEPTALFKRTIGEDTDIVSKEMYTFEDRNGESVTLRPEGTAGCVRAGIERNLLYNQIQRLWYLGPMFRREKPQKGRYRQFYQFGLEAFGMSGPNIDAELIVMGQRLWEALGIQDQVRLEINSLGTPDSRAAYRIALKAYFQAHYNDLDADSQRRLETNPLRILDSKVASMQTLIESAPCLTGYLDEASRAHFDGLCAQLDALGVSYRINPHLVRGLDYYSFTVFEWITDALGAQGTVCAGGRYDVLVEQLGGKPTPAVGLAMGLERLILLIEQTQRLSVSPDIYGVCIGDAAMQMGLVLAERLRYALPHLHIEMDCAGGSMKAQFKRADKRGADYAVVLGDTEIAAGQVTLKPLRKQADQQTLTENELISYLSTLSNEHHKPNSLRAIGDEHE